jgi:hypothetical protein
LVFMTLPEFLNPNSVCQNNGSPCGLQPLACNVSRCATSQCVTIDDSLAWSCQAPTANPRVIKGMLVSLTFVAFGGALFFACYAFRSRKRLSTRQ